MTLVSGEKMIYRCEKLSFSEIATIIRHRSNARQPGSIPTVYFDVSWLARKLHSNSDNGSEHIINLAKQFSEADINIVLVMDNRGYRHHSKKSTIIRNAKAEQSRIDSFMLRKELMAKVEQMRSPDTLISEVSILTEEMRCIEK